jgi:MFS family permease
MSSDHRVTLLGIAALTGPTALAAAYPAVTGQEVSAHWAPTWAEWRPRMTAWTPAAVAVAVALLAGAPLAGRLSWRWLLLAAWVATWVWTMALALVDGRPGIASTFARPTEYLVDARSVDSLTQALADFISRIPMDAPNRWNVHVAGHPIGALLLFVGLVRLGFDDPFSLGLLVLTLGTTAVTAVMIALRAIAGEGLARVATPFLVLGPAAVFVGVSADGVYMALTAWGLAALAAAATSSTWHAAPLGVLAGLLLGGGVYVSYGLPLVGLIALGTLLAARTWRVLPWALCGAAAVAAVFTAAGFAWWDA